MLGLLAKGLAAIPVLLGWKAVVEWQRTGSLSFESTPLFLPPALEDALLEQLDTFIWVLIAASLVLILLWVHTVLSFFTQCDRSEQRPRRVRPRVLSQDGVPVGGVS